MKFEVSEGARAVAEAHREEAFDVIPFDTSREKLQAKNLARNFALDYGARA